MLVNKSSIHKLALLTMSTVAAWSERGTIWMGNILRYVPVLNNSWYGWFLTHNLLRSVSSVGRPLLRKFL
jgi:hypothetical protein